MGVVGETSADVKGLVDRLIDLGAGRDLLDGPYEDDGGIQVERAEEPTCQFVIGVGAPGDELPPSDADVWISRQAAPEQLDELWHTRLVPFELNLRTERRAPRRQEAVIVGPDATWPAQARRLMARLVMAIGMHAIRIDHVGSTSVPGLAAKELIDLQVVVSDLQVAAEVANHSREAGFVRVHGRCHGIDRHGTEHEEQVTVDADPGRPVNVHLHPVGSPLWRELLLFRDWLRADSTHRADYVTLKRDLAARSGNVDEYSDAKMPWIAEALARAEDWATATGWTV